MKRLILAALATAALSGWPAAAQPPAAPDALPVVDELIVRAYGGPPWWVVSDGDTKVYVLASPTTLPGDVAFDQTLLNKRLTGANEVILPATNAPPPLLSRSKIKRLSNDINHNRRNELEPSLSPAVRARFVRLREAIGMPAERYGGLSPGLAAMALAGDYASRNQKALPPMKLIYINQVVTAAARKKRVKTAPAYVYRSLSPFIDELRLPGMPCMLATLEDLERPRPEQGPYLRSLAAMGRAWAEGDIRPIANAVTKNGVGVSAAVRMQFGDDELNLMASSPACLNAMPSQARIQREWVDNLVNPIVRALKKPGHAVAVVQAGPLIMQDGVLDRLRRRGFTITTPDRAGD